METKSLKHQEFYSRSLCIKHRAASKDLIYYLFWLKNERNKVKHVNFSPAGNKLKYVMMLPPMAKWSFILLFCKPFSCSQLLSKVFALMINICRCWQMGWNGSPWVVWEGRKGKMLGEARERTSKGRKRGEEGRRVQGWMDE